MVAGSADDPGRLDALPGERIGDSSLAGGTALDVKACAEILERATSLRPRILVALGSGLGGLTEEVTDAVSVALHDLPGIPAPGVIGHAGRLVAGRLGSVPVWIQAGRLHVYEGFPASLVAVPIRIAARLGVEVVVLTNAAGGIRPDLDAGSIVLLADLLNLSLRDPIPGDPIPGRNVACSAAGVVGAPEAGAGGPSWEGVAFARPVFDPSLQELVLKIAGRLDDEGEGRLDDESESPRGEDGGTRLANEGPGAKGLRLSRGTYAGVLGPSFETAAEIRMIRRLGGDVVGMSTVPEALMARQLGMRTVGLSLVTNRAAGLRRDPLSHEEVVGAAGERGPEFAALIRAVVRELGRRLG